MYILLLQFFILCNSRIYPICYNLRNGESYYTTSCSCHWILIYRRPLQYSVMRNFKNIYETLRFTTIQLSMKLMTLLNDTTIDMSIPKRNYSLVPPQKYIFSKTPKGHITYWAAKGQWQLIIIVSFSYNWSCSYINDGKGPRFVWTSLQHTVISYFARENVNYVKITEQ